MRFRHAMGGIFVVALIALPVTPAAGQGGQVATLAGQQCAKERGNAGRKAFRKRYGVKHTMRACAKRHRAQVVSALATASQDCQAELAELGPADFIDEYWGVPTDTVDYAMAECIAEDVDMILNPEDYVDDPEDDGTDDA